LKEHLLANVLNSLHKKMSEGLLQDRLIFRQAYAPYTAEELMQWWIQDFEKGVQFQFDAAEGSA